MKIFLRALHWIFLRNTQCAPRPEWRDALERTRQIEVIQVERDGKPICCLSITKPDTPTLRGVALLMHPITRYAKYFFVKSDLVQTYLDLGYRVVVMDFNGYGESEFNDFRYWQDIVAVTSEIRKRFPEPGFVAHGLSFSGFVLIPVIHRLPNNAKIVIENIYDSFYGFWRKWLITRCLGWVLEALRISWIREMNIKKRWQILIARTSRSCLLRADRMRSHP